jgi:DNA-directed RNA polymerase specialized sigma subunit
MPRILERVAQLVNTGALSRKEQDLALWRAWKRNPSDINLSALLKQVNPLIQRETNKWSGTLARPLLETEGKRLAVEAFQNYDPNRGAALATHVVNRLQKMSRLSYSNQNVARLPENKVLQFHTYHVGHSQLRDDFGRPPTTDEMADHLGWTLPQVNKFNTQIGRQELIESVGVDNVGKSLAQVEASDHLVDFVHHDLPPVQRSMFEHLTGYQGASRLSNKQIQKKLGLTQGQYSYQKRKLIDTVGAVQGGGR